MSVLLANPVPGIIHPKGWVRPSGNTDYAVSQNFSTTHAGLDIYRPGCLGAPLAPMLPGIVVRSGWLSDKSGWTLGFDHGAGLYTDFRHLKYDPSKAYPIGKTVLLGQTVALIGQSGAATGPHVHISVRLNGIYVDPWPWLAQNHV